MPMGLDLSADPIALTAALVDIPSVSRDERRIADEIEAALRAQAPHFEVIRNGDAVLARTNLGRPSRVMLAGHIDTVPIADNLPSRIVDGEMYGCGTSDMKAGDAVFLHLAATITEPTHDITLVMYDCEEIESSANGLGASNGSCATGSPLTSRSSANRRVATSKRAARAPSAS